MVTGAPGVFVEEKPTQGNFEAGETSVTAIVGPTVKGPLDKVGIVTSVKDFVRQYSAGAQGSFMSDAITAYFENGGGTALVASIKGSGSAVAGVPITNNDEGDTNATAKSIAFPGGVLDTRLDKFVGLDVDDTGTPVVINVGATAVNPALVTPTEAAAAINAAGFGVVTTVEGTSIRITSPTPATGSLEFSDPASPQPAQFFGLGLSIADIGVGNNKIDVAFDALGTGDWEPIITSLIFPADPTNVFGPTNYSLDIDIGGLGLTPVDITGDLGVGGSYTMAAIASQINTILHIAYGTSDIYARASVAPGRRAVEVTNPVNGPPGTVEIRPSAANSAHLAFLGVEIPSTGISTNGAELDFTFQTGIGGYTLTPAILVENLNQAFANSGTYGAYSSAASLNSISGFIDITGIDTGPTGEVRFFDSNGRRELFGIPEGTGTVTVNGTTGEVTNLLFGYPDATTTKISAISGRDAIATVSAASAGLHGNDVKISTVQWETTSAAALSSGATSIVLTDATKARVGDMIRFLDTTTGKTVYKFIRSVALSTNTVVFQGSVHDTVPSGSPVSSPSDNRQVTTSSNSAVLPVASTIIPLVTTFGIKVGAQVIIDDGTNPIQSVIVSAVPGDGTIVVPALASPVDPGAIVATQHFDLVVTDIVRGNTETITFLSAHPTDPDFIATRLSTAGEGSDLIEVSSLFPLPDPPADPFYANVFPHKDLVLTAGSDGATPVDADFIAAQSIINASLIPANLVIVPGITTLAVQSSYSAYAEARGDIMYLGDTPPLSDTVPELLQHRRGTYIDTSFTAIYGTWVVMPDTSPNASPGATKLVPPSPAVAGIYGQVAATSGVHVAPANISIAGAIGVSHNFTTNEQALLVPDGINLIRSFPGTGLAVIFDALTLSSDAGFQFVPVRRLTTFIKESFKQLLRTFLFQPNNADLAAQIKRTAGSFMVSLWRQGMLVPQNDADASHTILVDSVPGSTVVVVDVRFSPVFFVRRLEVALSLKSTPTGTTVTETVVAA